MGWNRYTERGVRRLARRTGLPVEAAIARGGTGHVILFRVAGDQHGRLWPDGSVDWGLDHWADCARRGRGPARRPAGARSVP